MDLRLAIPLLVSPPRENSFTPAIFLRSTYVRDLLSLRIIETFDVMTSKHFLTLTAAVALAFSAHTAGAKDKPVSVSDCPAAVQAVIKHYETQGKLEEVARDDKKKTGGPAVYEAKFELADGKRVEVHIAADGKVLQIENKKSKSEKEAEKAQ